MSAQTKTLLPPIEAYDRIASRYAEIRAARRRYCDSIDEIIGAHLPTGARSLLDIGCGDGERAERIAGRKVGDVVLLEPSRGMRRLIRSGRETWTSPIEDIEPTNRMFHVITCLWNVLGHVQGRHKQVRALRNMRALLAPSGSIFLDVQNRYNARRYGVAKTAMRFVRDRILPSSTVGDVVVHWMTEHGEVRTHGHFFTPSEIESLVSEADLTIKNMFFVDYESGKLRRTSFEGSILSHLVHRE